MGAKSNQDGRPRDPLKPASFFHKVISEVQVAIDRDAKIGLAAVMRPVPRRCLQVAMAHYCAGDSIKECLHWLDQAVTYKLVYFEKWKYQLGGFGDLFENLETLSAASLVGRGAELVDAYSRCKLEDEEVPRARLLMDQAFGVFKHEPVRLVKAQMDDLKKRGKELVALAPLFKSVSDRDAGAFATTLDNFLGSCWAKEVKGNELGPQYSGKWSILSAALSQLMGGVPPLPDKTRLYIPVELVR